MTISAAPRAIQDAPGSRLSRAAIFAGAAGAAAIVVGCSSSDPTPGPAGDSGTAGSDSSTGVAQPVYGAPALDAGTSGGGGTTDDDGGHIASPVYGAPFNPDGGA